MIHTAPDLLSAANDAFAELQDGAPDIEPEKWDLIRDAFISGFMHGFVHRGELELPEDN